GAFCEGAGMAPLYHKWRRPERPAHAPTLTEPKRIEELRDQRAAELGHWSLRDLGVDRLRGEIEARAHEAVAGGRHDELAAGEWTGFDLPLLPQRAVVRWHRQVTIAQRHPEAI